MKNSGWVKVYRSIASWEWYTDANTFRVFFHMLIKANHEEKRWQGITLKRGQLVINPTQFGAEIGLSRQQVRTAFQKLERTGEITSKSTNKYTLLTIEKYSFFQETQEGITSKSTNKQPSNNQQITNKNSKLNQQITSKEARQVIENNAFFSEMETGLASDQPSNNQQNVTNSTTTKEIKNKEVLGGFVPPTENQVYEYFLSRGFPDDGGAEARRFIDHYSCQGWARGNGQKITRWVPAFREWLRRKLQNEGARN